MNNQFEENLKTLQKIYVQQSFESFEFLTGFETRNKYHILDHEMKPIAYAAEKTSGWTDAIARSFLRHWRSFEVQIFTPDRDLIYAARFPFRWFFKTLYLEDAQGESLGELHQRFAFFYKRFDLLDPYGALIAQVKSPWFKFWTFEFTRDKRKIGTIQKKWSGALSELFTDKDNFMITFTDRYMDQKTKTLMVASCLMIDIVYFENKK